jgi:hypothetical protein
MTPQNQEYLWMPRRKKRGRGRAAAGRGGASVVGALKSYHAKLLADRNSLSEQISVIERAISDMGGTPLVKVAIVRSAAGARAGPGRRRREGSLKEFIVRVLKSSGKPMAVKDITEGVRAAGYPTRNQTLAKSVGITLTQTPGVRKISRGVFGLK